MVGVRCLRKWSSRGEGKEKQTWRNVKALSCQTAMGVCGDRVSNPRRRRRHQGTRSTRAVATPWRRPKPSKRRRRKWQTGTKRRRRRNRRCRRTPVAAMATAKR